MTKSETQLTLQSIEKRVGENMGCYLRIKTDQWVKERFDEDKKYLGVSDLTLEVRSASESVLALFQQALTSVKTGCVDCGKRRCENCERLWQS